MNPAIRSRERLPEAARERAGGVRINAPRRCNRIRAVEIAIADAGLRARAVRHETCTYPNRPRGLEHRAGRPSTELPPENETPPGWTLTALLRKKALPMPSSRECSKAPRHDTSESPDAQDDGAGIIRGRAVELVYEGDDPRAALDAFFFGTVERTAPRGTRLVEPRAGERPITNSPVPVAPEADPRQLSFGWTRNDCSPWKPGAPQPVRPDAGPPKDRPPARSSSRAGVGSPAINASPSRSRSPRGEERDRRRRPSRSSSSPAKRSRRSASSRTAGKGGRRGGES